MTTLRVVIEHCGDQDPDDQTEDEGRQENRNFLLEQRRADRVDAGGGCRERQRDPERGQVRQQRMSITASVPQRSSCALCLTISLVETSRPAPDFPMLANS
jgi:hypothetical protein